MKKYILILITSLVFFSCSDDNDIDISGMYSSILIGKYQYSTPYPGQIEHDYNNANLMFVLSKINDSDYSLCTAEETNGYIRYSEKSIVKVNNNTMKGEFYLYGYYANSKGKIDGIITNDSIYGTFTANVIGRDNITHDWIDIPIENGRFTLKYKSQLNQ